MNVARNYKEWDEFNDEMDAKGSYLLWPSKQFLGL